MKSSISMYFALICIIVIGPDVIVGQFTFDGTQSGTNREFTAQNTNFNQNRNDFGVVAIGGQSTSTNFNQQNFGAGRTFFLQGKLFFSIDIEA